MFVSTMKRDPAVIKADLVQQGDRVITRGGCVIHFPAIWESKGLASVAPPTQIFGQFAIVVGEHYAWFNHAAMVSTDPTSKKKIMIDGMEYYEFTYVKGAVVISNMVTMAQNTLVFPVFDQLLARAKTPWYMRTVDEEDIYVTASRAADAHIIDDASPVSMMVAHGTRQKEDRMKFYRHVAKDLAEANLSDYTRVPLASPIFGGTNATARLIGAHAMDSLMMSMANPTEEPETLESLLRI